MSTHIFEPITDRFGYGNYLDLRIIIDNKTKYINATKLCTRGDKHLYHWCDTDTSKRLLKYWESLYPSISRGVRYEIKRSDIKGVPKDDADKILGTYYHEDIIPHIAQWISPEFAIKVSHIIKEYVQHENEKIIRALKGENESLQRR
jgi:hypothetical protein